MLSDYGVWTACRKGLAICRVIKKVKTTLRGMGTDRKKHDSSFQKWILRHLHAGCEAGNERRRHDLHNTIALNKSQQERYTRNQHRSIRNCRKKGSGQWQGRRGIRRHLGATARCRGAIRGAKHGPAITCAFPYRNQTIYDYINPTTRSFPNAIKQAYRHNQT
jgi:hypothetical protein